MKLHVEVLERNGAWIAICIPKPGVLIMGAGDLRKAAERQCMERLMSWLSMALGPQQAGSSLGIDIEHELRDGLEVVFGTEPAPAKTKLVALDS